MASKGQVKAGEAYVEITARSEKLKEKLGEAKQMLKDFGVGLETVGKTLMGAGGAIAGVLAGTATQFAKFDDVMLSVKAKSGATVEDFEKLTELAKKIGRETSFSDVDAGSGMEMLAMAGFTPSEIQASIASVMDLARATGTGLADACSIASNTMRAFGIDASQMNTVADVLTSTANGANMSLSDLGEAMKTAAPISKALGVSIQTTSALLATLANNGIKGSEAGTQLKIIMSRMAMGDVQKKLTSLGIAVKDASGNLRDVPTLLGEIGAKFSSMTTAEKAAYGVAIFGKNALSAGLALSSSSEAIANYQQMLVGCAGTAQQTATEMDSGIGGSFRRLSSAVGGIVTEIGGVVSSAILPMVEYIANAINGITDYLSKNSQVIGYIGMTAAALLGLGAAFLLVGKTITIATAIYGVFAAVTHGVSLAVNILTTSTATFFATLHAGLAPLWLVVGLIGGLLATAVILTGVFDGMGGAMLNGFQTVADAMKGVSELFLGGDIIGAATYLWNAIKIAFAEGINPVLNNLSEFYSGFQAIWIELKYWLLDFVYGLADGVVNGIYSMLEEIEVAWAKLTGIMDDDKEVEAKVTQIRKTYADARQAQTHDFSKEKQAELDAAGDSLNATKSARQEEIDAAKEQNAAYLVARKKGVEEKKKVNEQEKKATPEVPKVAIPKMDLPEVPELPEQEKKETATPEITENEVKANDTFGSFYASMLQDNGNFFAGENLPDATTALAGVDLDSPTATAKTASKATTGNGVSDKLNAILDILSTGNNYLKDISEKELAFG